MSEQLGEGTPDLGHLESDVSIDAMRAVFALGQIYASETIREEVDAASAALDIAVEHGEADERIAQLRKNLSYWRQVEIGYRGTHGITQRE